MQSYLRKVRKEIKNIRQHIPLERRLKLSFEKLDPSNIKFCIYGMIFGNCFNPEAIKAIKLCCNTRTSFPNVYMHRVSTIPPRYNALESYSYLENFIILYPTSNKEIIEYLREEKDTFKLHLK